MTEEPCTLRVEFRRGPGLLFGLSLRAYVVFLSGRSTEEAERLWTAATTDTGPEGEAARKLVRQATDIQITLQATD
jgi:hypothetical protein